MGKAGVEEKAPRRRPPPPHDPRRYNADQPGGDRTVAFILGGVRPKHRGILDRTDGFDDRAFEDLATGQQDPAAAGYLASQFLATPTKNSTAGAAEAALSEAKS